MAIKLVHVVGARPNFVKIAPIYREIAARPEFEQTLVHTGQHYDPEMSGIFFEEFGLPEPDYSLAVGSGSHAVQTASVMTAFEPVVKAVRPDWVVVVGDVNSTVAAAIVAVKMGVKVAHVEAGLRSFDRTMPEEINRILTDAIANLLLTPSRDGDENLLKEGVDPGRIRFVGNVMIDTLVKMLPRAQSRAPAVRAAADLGERYALATLHRPANVDDPSVLREIVAGLNSLSRKLDMPVAFPVHPRTRARLADFDIEISGDIRLLEPMSYIDFLALTSEADLVVTDSGGVQEETTYLGIPCLTVRPNTERPVTISRGTNQLVEARSDAIVAAALDAARSPRGVGSPPDLWDGATAGRIADALLT